MVLASAHHGRIRSGIVVPETGAIDIGEISLSALAEGEEATLELAGIGGVLSATSDVLVVNVVLPGGGAAEVGIVPGDEVLAIDGVPVTTLRFEGSIERIRGVEGTYVHLRVRHDGQETELDVPRRRVRR